MFGRRQKAEREELKTIFAEFKRDREQQENAQSGVLEKLGQEMAACREQTDLNGKSLGRQLARLSEAVEDILEERKALETATELYERQIKESQDRENMLLALLCRYQEELGLIEERLHNTEQQYAKDWLEQLSLFRRSLETELRQCSIEETGKPGERVDYSLHEILDAAETEKPEQDGTVAYCYRTGCVYQGRVITKAQVRAYKRRSEE